MSLIKSESTLNITDSKFHIEHDALQDTVCLQQTIIKGVHKGQVQRLEFTREQLEQIFPHLELIISSYRNHDRGH